MWRSKLKGEKIEDEDGKKDKERDKAMLRVEKDVLEKGCCKKGVEKGKKTEDEDDKTDKERG